MERAEGGSECESQEGALKGPPHGRGEPLQRGAGDMRKGSVPGRRHRVLLHYRCRLIFQSKYSGMTVNVNSIPWITCITQLTRVTGNLGTRGPGACKDEEVARLHS